MVIKDNTTGGSMDAGIRFEVQGEPIDVVLCHCVDCRRATAAPVSALAGYRLERFRILTGRPAIFASSPGVRRAFCPRSGTPLWYEDERLPGEIWIHVGAFDRPEAFAPRRHAFISQKVPWLRLADDLPRADTFSRPGPAGDRT